MNEERKGLANAQVQTHRFSSHSTVGETKLKRMDAGHPYTRAYVRAYIHTLHTFIHTCTHAYRHACIQACMHTYLHTH